MAAAKAWGLLPAQWLALDPAERSLIAAHEANQARCPGCGTPLLVTPDEIDGIDVDDRDCLVCESHERIEKRVGPRSRKNRTKPWMHRFFLLRLKPRPPE